MESVVKKRDMFTSQKGFVLASIGSAVGMGNIWLFPYRTCQFGGFPFIIAYLTFVILIGFVGEVCEISFGRMTKGGPLKSFRGAIEKNHKSTVISKYIGLIPVIGSFFIAVGYSVVVGWIIKFSFLALTGSLVKGNGDFFIEMQGNFGSFPWHLAAILITVFVMRKGISRGIEKLNAILMPLFFFMFVGLALYTFFNSKEVAGYEFMFKGNLDSLLDPKLWIYALGQAFFSLSLAGSGTLIYGSYLNKNENVFKNSLYISIFDTIAAILAVFVIVPWVFKFDFDLNAGPALMFITMPKIFEKMEFGFFFSVVFFISVFFAGISSLVNLYETPVEFLQTKLNLKREKAVAVILSLGFLLGLFFENGDNLSKLMDIVSIYAVPLGAFIAAFIFFYIVEKEDVLKAVSQGSDFRNGNIYKVYYYMGKYVYTTVTLFVYIVGIFYGSIG